MYLKIYNPVHMVDEPGRVLCESKHIVVALGARSVIIIINLWNKRLR